MTGVHAIVAWSLSVWGVTQIVTQSKFFAGWRGLFQAPDEGEPIRSLSNFFGVLFSCSMCFGWWVGASWHLVGFGLLSNDMGIRAVLVPEIFPPFGDAVSAAIVPRSIPGWAVAVFLMMLDGACGSALCEGARILSERMERK